MMQDFNPYAAMSAEDLQGLAQKQSLDNIKRQQDFILKRRGEADFLANLPQQTGANYVMPLAGITDAWTGSNFTKQAQALSNGNEDRQAMLAKIENSISNSEGVLNRSTNDLMDAALREKLAKQQNDLLNRKIGAQSEDPLKDFEFKAANMGQRATLAEDQYNAALQKAAVEKYDPISRGSSFDASTIGKAANFMGMNEINPLQKEIDAAEVAFLTSTLRDESGATITPAEAKNQAHLYYPRFGDTPEVIANKAALREATKIGLQQKAGKAWNKVNAAVTANPAPKAPAAKKPTYEEWKASKGIK